MAEAFFDTNVVLYLVSGDSAKADVAEAVVARGGHVSVQVLNEFASVAHRKAGMSWEEIGEFLGHVRRVCAVHPLLIETHERGLDLAKRHGLSLYDALIVAAATLAGCRVLYSEDLQSGRRFDGGVVVRNPFGP